MKLSYFEQTQLQSAIMREWQLAASTQGTPDASWARIAAHAVVQEIGSWDDNTVPREWLEHLSWLRTYVGDISEENWRDMRLYLLRQIERLESLAAQAEEGARSRQSPPPPDTDWMGR